MKHVLWMVAGLGLVACTPDKVISQATSGPSTAAAPAAPAADAGATAAVAVAAPKMDFAESDFSESDRNRDPFRTYVSVLGPETKRVAHVQREVILPQFSLDELKLVAIVTGGEYPRAMLVDPGGKGWVIKRGDWVGRPEVVHVGGANGADYQINWRVDKVRDGDLVFTREDPAQPGIPPASRVITLRQESDSQREKL
jgi:type IV pilus assembly protein PilP